MARIIIPGYQYLVTSRTFQLDWQLREKKYEGEKVQSRNNNIRSTAKLIRVDLSSIGTLLCFISPLLKRASGITTTLIPVTSCSPCCVKRSLKKNRNGAARVQSHYTLVSLKGQHISLVPTASCSSQVVTRTQRSANYIEM